MRNFQEFTHVLDATVRLLYALNNYQEKITKSIVISPPHPAP